LSPTIGSLSTSVAENRRLRVNTRWRATALKPWIKTIAFNAFRARGSGADLAQV
jgi:hypothetical protein